MKDQVFVDEYLLTLNATKAYQKAHPKAKATGAAVNGHKLLRKTNVQEEISRRLEEQHMSANEALKIISDIARGDITEFFTPLGNIDFEELRKSGRGRLIKKIKQRTITKIGKGEQDEDTEIHDTEIEIYPALDAARDILKVTKKLPADINIQVNITDD